jgi:uncharacterized protein YcaQ
MGLPCSVRLSEAEVRKLTVVAQGFGDDCMKNPLDVLARLGAIQLDAIQRVDKAHRLACFARLPGFSGRTAIDEGLWSSGEAKVFETWIHAVCLVQSTDWPLWAFRRRRTEKVHWRPDQTVCDRLLGLVADRGPVTITDLEKQGARSSGWNWSATKQAAEYLVWTGALICCERRGTRRIYDLPERRLPADVVACDLSYDESMRQVVQRAVRACGVATLTDIAEYFQITAADAMRGVELADIVEVEVENWGERAWADPAVLDLRVDDAEPALLSPFDNLIWNRKRTRRVFGFDYVFEAYKTPTKRKYGYYVTPLLAGDRLIGRADLVRDGSMLEILASYAEPGRNEFDEALSLAVERLQWQMEAHQ